MLFIIILFVFLFIIIALFAFPVFSPIPYFPSNRKDLKLIIQSLNLKKNQTIIDLGAGDGIIIFEAAKESLRQNLNTQFIAVEINPVLLLILFLRRLLNPNSKNIQVRYGNMFTINFNSLTREPANSLIFYLYISPWYLEKVIKNLKLKIKNFKVVSYMYPIKSLLKREKKVKGNIHSIYMYNI